MIKNIEKDKGIKDKSEIEKKIKLLANDYVKGLSNQLPKEILDFKKEKLKQSIMKFKLNGVKEKNLDDECEMDLDNQVELQKIKDKKKNLLK